MTKLLISLLDFCRLFLAGVICTLIILIIFCILPINNVPDLLPNHLIVNVNELSLGQKRIVETLYLKGELLDAKALYGKIIEYYHFLVFLIFGLLALIGGFVYLQIKQSIFEQKYETENKIEKKIEDADIGKKIKDKINEANIANKIDDKIKDINIDKKINDIIIEINISKKIDDKIDEEELAEKTIQSVIDNPEYMRQLKETVHQSFDDDLNTIREDLAAALKGIQSEIDNLKNGNDNGD